MLKFFDGSFLTWEALPRLLLGRCHLMVRIKSDLYIKSITMIPKPIKSNARLIPLAFSFVCIESNLLHNLIRKNPGRLPVRVSAPKKPEKKNREWRIEGVREEKNQRGREGSGSYTVAERPEEERIGHWLDLSSLYSTLPTRFVSATCIRIMFQLEFAKSLALNFLFHVWTQEKAS